MKARRVAAVGLVVLLSAGACGGEDEAEEPQAEATQTQPATAPVDRARSSSGGFSVAIPEGWRENETNETSDLFLSDETQSNVELGVTSGPIASEAGLTEYVEGQRQQVEAFTNVTDVTEATSDLEVGGSTTTTFDWFFNAETEQGDTDLVERRVMFVHEGELFDVKLQAPQDVSEDAFADLDQILASWEFGGAGE